MLPGVLWCYRRFCVFLVGVIRFLFRVTGVFVYIFLFVLCSNMYDVLFTKVFLE